MNDFETIFEFEKTIAEYFNAPYGIATDCCTHALEMCLTLNENKNIICPKQTYISIPFMLERSFPYYIFSDIKWIDYYHLTSNVIDAATYWEKNGYIKNTKMCLSFHFKKHLNIGKGGMILLDDKVEYNRLQKMRYDGRSIYENVMYSEDDIKEMGYHYYMTPDNAKKGLEIFEKVKNIKPKKTTFMSYSDVTEFTYFKNKYLK